MIRNHRRDVRAQRRNRPRAVLASNFAVPSGTMVQPLGSETCGVGSVPKHSAPIEEMFLRVFLLMRAYHVFSGLLTLVFDRRRFVRPRLGWLVFAAMTGESTWLSRRALRRGDYADAASAAVDVGVVAASLVLCSAALPAQEQFNAANWMFPVSLMSGVGAVAAFPRRRGGFLATSGLAGSYALAAGMRSKRCGAPMVLGIAQYVNCAIAGDLLTRRVRATSAEIARLRAEAVELAHERTRNETRVRLQTELHVGTLQALGSVRDHLVANDATRAQALARTESARLRRALSGDGGRSAMSVRSRIDQVVASYAGSTLRIEVVDDGEDPSLRASTTDVMCEVLAALLVLCASVSSTTAPSPVTMSQRIVVALTSDDHAVELSVRSAFHADEVEPCIDPALLAAVQRVGGAIEVEPGRSGVSLVTLRIDIERGWP